ncbi:SpaA isopeptide-forming pilin-related protein [Bifidobacterium merycicum]|uniref:Cell surface protein n=1 Tax=Bifidobacterium merycicum TaxID=78345 RepID=A0A087BDB0_9BIFI|nr:SpaA isopeptide-forming pilin-related protein [Bifidobacterium merycicum]KFI69010.1 cell surface protein [Bifidobacterium merycicum]SHE65109.1 LPXTG-motif cell wall anchor domain-containing protein/choice-of-anchor A domain-containing protein [Bifidobacterium merycicum DSM 6492]
MRHQVERLKHVALRQGVKPARALTAALVAVGMMATIAVTSPIPAYNAKAEEPADGKTCTPASVGLGDDMSVEGSDTGVATYVGGDMYVGGKENSNLNSETGPTGTYAVEAEGLTVVNGSLAMHPLKDAWKVWNTGTTGGKHYTSRGFRWGVVGFGSQFRPADGKTALVVGGNTNTSVMGSKVGAWGAPGWLGKTDANDINSHGYKASLAGSRTGVWGSNDSIDSVRGLNGINDTEGDITPTLGTDPSLVEWKNQPDNLSNVNGTDYSGYKGKISKLSTDLSNVTKLPVTGTVATGTAEAAAPDYTIYKYDYRKNGNKGNSFTFYRGQLEHEKLITFTSIDTSKSMQVFNLPASSLNLNGTDYTGIDFKFVNVPDNASVVVNVTGANGQTIDFHNGWRFWWNNDNIANDFVTAASEDATQAAKNTNYAKRAQQIMWNFADASNVVIRGGQATGWIQVTDHNTNPSTNHGAWGSAHDMRATDDPSAAWMGSILVPNGSLQSHVSTNGRVWVGGDFEMLNNETVKKVKGQSSDHAVGSEFINESGEKTTSILDMDQERHNLPWNGSYSTSCAAIAWNKVDDTAGHNALGGTSWTVYGKKEDAVHGTNALATIADGGWNDDADAEGSIQLGNLAKNGTYFLKESGTAEGYAQNTNIYQINTGSTTDAATNISSVFDSAGKVISTDADKLLTTDGKIINKKTGSAIEWQKVDGTDNNTLLAGSTWTLSKMNGNTAEQSWNITDDQSGTEVKSVKIFDANNSEVVSASFTNSTAQQFHAVAYDQNGTPIDNAKLTWSSANSAVAAVSENGLVTPTGDGNTIITVKSADGNVTASFTVNVSGVAVETSVSINGYTDGQEINLEKGKTLNLIASVDPEGNTVTWSTSNNTDNVSLSTTTGTSVTLTANSVTSSPVIITAKEAQGKTFTLKVNVTAKQYLTLYFQAQNDWPANNVKVHYQTTNDTDWTDIRMTQMDGSCNSYAYANIPLTGGNAIDSTSQFGFQHINGNGWYGPGSASVPKANDQNFKFTNDNTLPEVVVISAGPSYSITAPSGCAVTSTAAYSSRRVAARSGEHRAVASVLRTQSNVVNVLENSTVSSKKDEDTKAGKFKVSDLADGTYCLQEETAPNGYEVSDTVYTITITNGAATWNSAPDGYKLPNTRKTGTVKWNKVSSKYNTEFLSGAEWKLTRIKTFSWNNGVATYVDASGDLGTVKDCVNGESGVSDCSTQSGQYVDLNGEKGGFELHGLAWGEYQLVETKAPDGFNLDSTPHMFRIGPAEGSDVTGEWYTSSGFKTDTTGAYNANTAFTVDGGSITNTPGVVLPSTGGEGLNKMYTAGFLAVAIAVAGLALSLRRRQS